MPTPADIILAGLSAQTQLGSQKIQVAYNQAHERDATMRGIADQLGKLPGLIQQGKAEKEEHDVNEAAAAGILSGDYDTAQKAIDNANTSTPQGARAKLKLALNLDSLKQEREIENQRRDLANRTFDYQYVKPEERRKLQMGAFARAQAPISELTLKPDLQYSPAGRLPRMDEMEYQSRSPDQGEVYDSLAASGQFTPQELVPVSREQRMLESLLRTDARGNREIDRKEERDRTNAMLKGLAIEAQALHQARADAERERWHRFMGDLQTKKVDADVAFKKAGTEERQAIMQNLKDRLDFDYMKTEQDRTWRQAQLDNAILSKLGSMLLQHQLTLDEKTSQAYFNGWQEVQRQIGRAKNPLEMNEALKSLRTLAGEMRSAINSQNAGRPSYEALKSFSQQVPRLPPVTRNGKPLEAVDTKATTSELDKLLGINR